MEGREGGVATESFVVDGRIDDEKLHELLQLQSEQAPWTTSPRD